MASAAEPLVPAGGDVDVGVGDFRVVLEDAARTCECDGRFEVPEGISVEVGACGCGCMLLVMRLK